MSYLHKVHCASPVVADVFGLFGFVWWQHFTTITNI